MPPPLDIETRRLHAELARDAALMRELQGTEAWACAVRQLDKMIARATDRILDQSQTMDQVNYWRGQLAAVREIRAMPDLIMGWAQRSTT